jgi:hypothetical protein
MSAHPVPETCGSAVIADAVAMPLGMYFLESGIGKSNADMEAEIVLQAQYFDLAFIAVEQVESQAEVIPRQFAISSLGCLVRFVQTLQGCNEVASVKMRFGFFQIARCTTVGSSGSCPSASAAEL